MSISSDELKEAFSSLARAWNESDFPKTCSWDEVKLLKQHGTSFLRITRCLYLDTAISSTDEATANDVHEDDDEALDKTSMTGLTSQASSAIYDIIHSPSYQVAVVYISFKDLPPGMRLSPDRVCEMLVPSSHKPQMAAVGVMGALSMTEHPITNLPVYFVHPCRTAEALRSMLAGQLASPVRYLLLWFGVVGSMVGLSVPTELAQAVSHEVNGA